jgi:hypothetical protein
VGGVEAAGFLGTGFGDVGGAAGFAAFGGCVCVGGGVDELMFVVRCRSGVDEFVFCATTEPVAMTATKTIASVVRMNTSTSVY